jgi:hypothetical protein
MASWSTMLVQERLESGNSRDSAFNRDRRRREKPRTLEQWSSLWGNKGHRRLDNKSGNKERSSHGQHHGEKGVDCKRSSLFLFHALKDTSARSAIRPSWGGTLPRHQPITAHFARTPDHQNIQIENEKRDRDDGKSCRRLSSTKDDVATNTLATFHLFASCNKSRKLDRAGDSKRSTTTALPVIFVPFEALSSIRRSQLYP